MRLFPALALFASVLAGHAARAEVTYEEAVCEVKA